MCICVNMCVCILIIDTMFSVDEYSDPELNIGGSFESPNDADTGT